MQQPFENSTVVEPFLPQKIVDSPAYLRSSFLEVHSPTKEAPVSVASVQFNSVAQSCPTLCDPVNRSTPGLSVHDQLPEFTQEVSNKSPCNEYSLGTSSFMYIVISKLHNNPRR